MSWSFGDQLVRTVTGADGEPWFVGKDVAQALGYQKPENAIAAHVDEDDKADTPIQGVSQSRNMTIINESGVYSLVFGSKLETAKAFKKWVTSEVLPAIRKHGGYITEDKAKEIETRLQVYCERAVAEQMNKAESYRAETARIKATTMLLKSETDALSKLEQLQKDGLIPQEDFSSVVVEFLRRARTMQPLAHMYGKDMEDDASILAFASHNLEIVGGRDSFVPFDDLYHEYEEFCDKSEPVTRIRFRHRLETLFNPTIEYNSTTDEHGFITYGYYGMEMKRQKKSLPSTTLEA